MPTINNWSFWTAQSSVYSEMEGHGEPWNGPYCGCNDLFIN